MKKILVIACVLACHGAYAQNAGPTTINSAGSSATISGNTYESSVAEMTVTGTYTSPTLVLTQGVLQPNAPATSVKGTALLNNNVKVYPNPVQNELNMQCDFAEGGKLVYELQDVTGKMLMQNQQELASGKGKLTISLAGMATGNYVLQLQYIQQAGTSSAIYKITKAQ